MLFSRRKSRMPAKDAPLAPPFPDGLERAMFAMGCFYAEDYHQQYLHKSPWGYCPDHGTGVSCPVGLSSSG